MMTPLQLNLVDLRPVPTAKRKDRLQVSLRAMEQGETLLVVNDRDSDLLLEELEDVLEPGFICWVTEQKPDVSRILISRSNN